MLKKIVFLFWVLIMPLSSFSQYHQLLHHIEIDLGGSKYKHQFGPALEVRYAMGFGKHFDLLASTTLMQGVDPDRIDHEFIHSQFQASSLQLGVRGNLDYLKICSFKASCQGGMMFLERTFVEEGQTTFSAANIPAVVSGRLEQCFKLSPVTELGLFYCSTWSFGWKEARFDRFGIVLSFRLE